jgi:hypothetical protein
MSLSRTAIASALLGLAAGCMTADNSAGTTAPPSPGPTITTYNTSPVKKVDILFDIDNSSSMGDKQQYLQAAVPDLINRLLAPYCVDAATGNDIVVDGVQLTADSNGACAMGQPEFPPVQDMHVGVLTSSLGGRGTTSICQTSTTPQAIPPDYLEYTSGSYQQYLLDSSNENWAGLMSIPRNNDDQAHLINRTDPPTDPDNTPSMLEGNFLAWVPAGSADVPPVNGVTETSAAQLVGDFQEIVIGAGSFGCGIESQLESWYRFLVQPDPYLAIVTTTNSNGLLVGSWSGVDTTILQQRADFLRPDSLVLILDLTDENDSEMDVRWNGGLGVNWLDNNFRPPRGTSACATNPASPQCVSCGFGTMSNDPNCTDSSVATSLAESPWLTDDNLRHVHMKQKYGVDVQFPIHRYVLGLTSQKVPDRNGEYPPGGNGFYQGGLNNDPGDLNCVNPLFAQNLPSTASGPGDPSLCDLAPSTARTPESNLVYYAHIGGVPHELLTTTDASGNVTVKQTLSASDWMSIVGTDPENYDYSGIDPHMIESYQPRAGIPVAGSGATIVGDEAPDYVTESTTVTLVNLPSFDVEYACVFPLATPRNCDPGNANNSEADISACVCSTSGLAADAEPSVCDAQNPLQQDYAKAYPTIRELELAQLLGTQGIVGSICPIDAQDNAAGNDPLYGYRPVIASIVDRLKAR